MSSSSPPKCFHLQGVSTGPSPHASEVHFVRRTPQQLATAAGKSKKDSPDHISQNGPEIFPSPLILPEDDLSWDPKYPPQSVRSWTNEKDRNSVTSSRKIIYVAAPPQVERGAEIIDTWCDPSPSTGTVGQPTDFERPDADDVWDYIRAFYHGLEVKALPSSALAFTRWDASSSARTKIPRNIGLKTDSENVRIRVRKAKDGVYPMQLNLNDLLDVAIAILPSDAYAVLMLVKHDLYEDVDDDFACGRAYGGSRVAVVSMARYAPSLDDRQGVERIHAWPASHCYEYIKQVCADAAQPPPRKRAKATTESTSSPEAKRTEKSALASALSAYGPPSSPSPSQLTLLWLSRVCRTAAHELGHCFGIDHCVYYACSMQGTASVAEDVRQPPYLCPIDLEKVLKATVIGKGGGCRARYDALLSFCEGKTDGGQLFDAFAAWLRMRLEGL